MPSRPDVVKPVLDVETAEKALRICIEEGLGATSLSECIRAIINYVDQLRVIEKLAKMLLGVS